MKTPIDLVSINGDIAVSVSPEGPRGPSVHFTSRGEKFGFPDEGMMKVRFKLRRREEFPQENRFEYCLELVELLDVKATTPEAPAKGEGEAGAALDSLRKELNTLKED